MQYIAIPLEVLDSEKYKALSMPDRQFLIDLYVMFADCERFTVDVKRPTDYGQKPCASIVLKLQKLLRAGFIKVVGRQKTDEYHSRRVFQFCYPPIEYTDNDDEVAEADLHDALVALNGNYDMRTAI